MEARSVRFEVRGGVGVIVLDRPKANAYSPRLAEELCEIAGRCDHDPDVRAVLLTGTGRFFSTGGDLAEFAAAGSGMGRRLADTALHIHAAVARFCRMDAPVVVAVNGTVAGGGVPLALCGDLVLAAASAKLTFGYAKVGLSPDGASTWLLPRLVGLRRAQELLFTDRVLSAEEARAWGLFTEVYPDQELLAEAEQAAARLAAGPTLAYGATKRLLIESFGRPLESQAELEARSIAGLCGSEDGKEGVAAFLERRPPRFGGR